MEENFHFQATIPSNKSRRPNLEKYRRKFNLSLSKIVKSIIIFFFLALYV